MGTYLGMYTFENPHSYSYVHMSNVPCIYVQHSTYIYIYMHTYVSIHQHSNEVQALITVYHLLCRLLGSKICYKYSYHKVLNRMHSYVCSYAGIHVNNLSECLTLAMARYPFYSM